MINTYYLFTIDSLIRNGKSTKGAIELLYVLSQRGLPYAILTEQSGRTRKEIADTMNEMGFHNINALDIYTSSLAAVDWIAENYPDRNTGVIIGGKGMKDAFKQGNLEINHISPNWLFLGLNTNLTYIDYCDALQLLDTGANLIITDERQTILKDGARMIGNGSIARMLEIASDQDGKSFGRGTTAFLNQAIRYFNVPADHITLVGTSFERDIVPSIRLGMYTVFVTQGNSIEDLGMNERNHPDYIVEDLVGLMK